MAFLSLDKIKPFEKRVYLSSPTMHGEELEYVTSAYNTNWMSTVGENINTVEKELSEMMAPMNAVVLSSGTAALHLAMKLAGVKRGERVFCSDMTFAATVNPITYEGGEQIFIDSEYDTWNMDPKALERAFELYPDVKTVVVANLYGVPAKLEKIKEICRAHNATLIEDAAESMGTLYLGRQTGTFGDISIVSFNGNKIITGSSGGALLTSNAEDAARARKWSTQARESASWYQHEEIGYNYRMSNVIAGVVRGQLPYLAEHIAEKRAIYERYKEGFADLPIKMNPFDEETTVPNYWLSCAIIDEAAMCKHERSATASTYVKEAGKTCPDEILEALAAINAEGRPIWKPMHMQPIFAGYKFVSVEDGTDVGADIFDRGICLPSDNKMTPEQQEKIIAAVRACFE